MEVKKKVIKKCNKCGYTWIIRVENPKSCPNCKHYFNREK